MFGQHDLHINQFLKKTFSGFQSIAPTANSDKRRLFTEENEHFGAMAWSVELFTASFLRDVFINKSQSLK